MRAITALALYAAAGATIGAVCLRGYFLGRLRWYSVVFGALAWPVALVGGVMIVIRSLRDGKA